MKNSIARALFDHLHLPIWIDQVRRFGLHKRSTRRIRGTGNTISIAPCIMNQVIFDIEGSHNTISIKNGSILNKVTFHIRGNHHHIIVGEKVSFRDTGSVLWMAGNNCQLVIGKGSTFEQSLLAATEEDTCISIGEDCMFAHSIDVRTGDSHSIINVKTGTRLNFAKNITIKDHVWVGKGAVILKGVTIGQSAIIGIGSVVTKDVAEESLVGGIPAKVLRSGVTWKRERLKKTIA